MMILKIGNPEILNDTVIFQWNSNKHIPVFNKNTFHIKYQGLNIEDLPIDVFWSVFLSLMVPIVNSIDEESLFLFPKSIPKHVAETWINFHEASKITIYPISEKSYKESLLSKVKKKVSTSKSYEAAVLFGGGKDSTYAYSLLAEILGINNVLLISYVYSWSQDAMSKVDKRRDNFMLTPLKRDLNTKIQKIISDFAAILTDFTKIQIPNVSLFTGPALPVIIKYDVQLLTHTNEFSSYRISDNETNDPDFNFKRSRPEYDYYLSERTNDYYNTSFSINNLSYFLSGPAAFKIITERYPHMTKYISMCESIGNPNRRWCQNCRKCAEYVLYSLCYKNDQKYINVNYFFSEGQYIRNLLENSRNLIPLTEKHENYPWVSSFSASVHFESVCHAIASIDPGYVRNRTSDKAFNNFMLLKSRYGNKKFPLHESFIEPAFNQLNLPYADIIKKIVTHHLSVFKESLIYYYRGNDVCKVDYNVKCEIPNIFSKNHGNFNLSKLENINK